MLHRKAAGSLPKSLPFAPETEEREPYDQHDHAHFARQFGRPPVCVARRRTQRLCRGRRAAQSLAASDGAALPHGAETKPDELDELDELDEATLSAIGRGLADVDAGRTLSLDEARADFRGVFAARYGSGSEIAPRPRATDDQGA